VHEYLFASSAAPYFEFFSELGIILFMFLVGLELDTSILRTRPRACFAIAREQGLAGTELGNLALCCAAVFVAMLLAAVGAERIGVHALIGAFSLGVCIPHTSRLASELRGRVGNAAVVLLLPAFFASTGMRTERGLVNSAAEWGLVALVVAVAVVGKVGGCYAAGRIAGLSRRDAAAMGALLNTRGLMKLVVLNVGLDLGVITPKLFTVFAAMAILTTIATGPALAVLNAGDTRQRRPWRWISGETMSTKS
jgi:Kef-type K+ transport system membrane component KefB